MTEPAPTAPGAPAVRRPMGRFTRGVVIALCVCGALALSYTTRPIIPWQEALIAVAVLTVTGVGFIFLARLTRGAREAQYARSARPRVRRVVEAVLCCWPLLPLGTSLIMSMPASALMLGLGFAGFCTVVTYLFRTGLSWRVGGSLHCAHCEYEYTFGDGPGAPERCPECGHPWRADLLRGRRVRSRPRLVTASVLLALGCVLVFSPLLWRGSLHRLLPTGVLAWIVAQSPRDSFAAWAELKTRTMTPERRLWLARQLLDARAGNRLWFDAGNFLEAEVAAGTLPADLTERYYAEMFTVRLSSPTRARVGEPFDVRLVDGMAWDTPGHRVVVYFAGFRVDDGPPLARRAEVVWGTLIAVDDVRAGGNEQYRPKTSVTISTPGRHTVRATMWVAVVPLSSGVHMPIEWNAEGAPPRPPGALWWRERVLESVVEVLP